MSLSRFRRTLLDPAGLDDSTAAVLTALDDANVIVFHLLGKGDASWLRRDAIVARLRELPPVPHPSTLFQSVLTAADKEWLRALVTSLGDAVRACLSAPDSASSFEEAARQAAQLLELRLVEHGFVTQLVEDQVAATVAERMAGVVTMIDALFLDGCVDG
jgi:hypothetical protein